MTTHELAALLLERANVPVNIFYTDADSCSWSKPVDKIANVKKYRGGPVEEVNLLSAVDFEKMPVTFELIMREKND